MSEVARVWNKLFEKVISLRPDFKNADYVYHYTMINMIEEFARECSDLYCTSYTLLNDTGEFWFGARRIFSCLEEGESSRKTEILRLIRDFLDTTITKDDSIAPWSMSFSLEGDSLSQWRAYTDASVGGVAMGFSKRKLDSLSKAGAYLLPCIYDLNAQKDLALWLDQEICDSANACLSPAEWATVVVIMASLFKDKCFEPEQEARLIVFPFRCGTPSLLGGKMRVPVEIQKQDYKSVKDMIECVRVSPHGPKKLICTALKGLRYQRIELSELPFK